MLKKLNAFVIRALERRSQASRIEAIEPTAEGFVVHIRAPHANTADATTHAWNDVLAAVAVQTPNVVGADECLLIECDTETLPLTPAVRGFEPFVAAAEAALAGWAPAACWRLALIRRHDAGPVDVYRRNRAA